MRAYACVCVCMAAHLCSNEVIVSLVIGIAEIFATAKHYEKVCSDATPCCDRMEKATPHSSQDHFG